MSEELALSDGERLNAVARRICAELERRLDERRKANDHVSSDAVLTAHTRGRIAELKELIALVQSPAP